MRVGRLEAFSDGVFAIVITLLILEVKVPPEAEGHLASALGRQWPQYVAYLISFLIVGIIWLNHHAMVQLLARADHMTMVLNLLLLLPVSVLPWPTSVLAEYAIHGTPDDQRTAVVVYGTASAAMAVGFNVFWRYLMRHPELLRPEVSLEVLRVRTRRYNFGLGVYPVATALGLLSVPLFLVLMLAIAFVYLLPTPDVQS